MTAVFNPDPHGDPQLVPEHLFVPVPPLDDYTSKNFCVAKYEMKEVTHTPDGGTSTTKILSVAKQTPKVQVTRGEAITKCGTMGSGYALITNAEWQTHSPSI